MEGQFGIIQEDNSNEVKSIFFREIKVHIHCGDVMYPSYTGALISLHNSKTREVFLHGDFGDKYFKDNEVLNEGVDLIARVQHGTEVSNAELDLGTIVDSSSM